MPLNPPAKRRRLESVASTLSKPFKSPLREPPHGTQSCSTTTSSDSNNGVGSLTSTSPDLNKEAELSASTSTSTPNTPTGATTTATTPIPTYHKRNPIHRNSKQADPELSTLQSQYRALATRLNALRSELETLNQAVRIESSSKDTELESLITKW
ncbi:DNA repair protein Dds20, partial [Aspergillus sclerotialis]